MKKSEFFKFKLSKGNSTSSLKKVVEINPFFYWKHILYIFFIILFVVTVASIFIYRMSDGDYFIAEKSRQEVQSLQLTQLKDIEVNRIIESFEKRESMREQIIEDKNIFSDPSLVVRVQDVEQGVSVQNIPR